MYKINRFIVILSQLIILIDSTKQYKFKLGLAAFKAIGKTVKNPMIKKVGDTVKKTARMLNQNKNTLKNLACSLENKVLTVRHNFGSKSVKYLGEEGIKNTAPQMSRKGKSNILMRSAAMISGKAKGFMPVAKEYLRGNELRSFVSSLAKSKPVAQMLLAAGGLGTLQMNLVKKKSEEDYEKKFGKPPSPKIISEEAAARPAGYKSAGLRRYEAKMAAKALIVKEDPDYVYSTDLEIFNLQLQQEKDHLSSNKSRGPTPKKEFVLEVKKETVGHQIIESQGQIRPETFDMKQRQEVRTLNNNYHDDRYERADIFQDKIKKLFAAKTQEHQHFKKEYEVLNKLKTKIKRKVPVETVENYEIRRLAYRKGIADRDAEFHKTKANMLKEFEDTNKEHLDKFNARNEDLEKKNAEYKKEYYEKNSENLRDLIKKRDTTRKELDKLEVNRQSEFVGKYRKMAIDLNNQEKAAKEALTKDLQENKTTKSIRESRLKAHKDEFAQKQFVLSREFMATNEASNAEFKEANKGLLDEFKEVATAIKKTDKDPFHDFQELHRDSVIKINKKYIAETSGKAIHEILKKEEIALKTEYELYQLMFPKKNPNWKLKRAERIRKQNGN